MGEIVITVPGNVKEVIKVNNLKIVEEILGLVRINKEKRLRILKETNGILKTKKDTKELKQNKYERLLK